MIEPFTKDGQSYYSYRFVIAAGILLNSVTTLVWEKFFIVWLTGKFDDKGKETKDKKFLELMQDL